MTFWERNPVKFKVNNETKNKDSSITYSSIDVIKTQTKCMCVVYALVMILFSSVYTNNPFVSFWGIF